MNGEQPAAQREVPPLPDDGVTIVGVGTALWAVALVVTIVLRDRLERDGRLWWLAATSIGTGLGLLGFTYCHRRAAGIARRTAQSSSSSA